VAAYRKKKDGSRSFDGAQDKLLLPVLLTMSGMGYISD
jgi:hypothetical protein